MPVVGISDVNTNILQIPNFQDNSFFCGAHCFVASVGLYPNRSLRYQSATPTTYSDEHYCYIHCNDSVVKREHGRIPGELLKYITGKDSPNGGARSTLSGLDRVKLVHSLLNKFDVRSMEVVYSISNYYSVPYGVGSDATGNVEFDTDCTSLVPSSIFQGVEFDKVKDAVMKAARLEINPSTYPYFAP